MTSSSVQGRQTRRGYLQVAVRNLAAKRSQRQAAAGVLPDDDFLLTDDDIDPSSNPVAALAEMGLVRDAFSELPRRWQVVLWRTAVNYDTHIEMGKTMGLSPNGVASLARRARIALRIAYLRAHLSKHPAAPGCAPFIGLLPQMILGTCRTPDRLTGHASSCRVCTARLAELRMIHMGNGALGQAA